MGYTNKLYILAMYLSFDVTVRCWNYGICLVCKAEYWWLQGCFLSGFGWSVTEQHSSFVFLQIGWSTLLRSCACPLIHGQQTVAGRIPKTCWGIMLPVSVDTWCVTVSCCRTTVTSALHWGTLWKLTCKATKSWCKLVLWLPSHSSELILWWTPWGIHIHT